MSQPSFWEPVYYKVEENESDHGFSSQSNEKSGHWVGFADSKGDQLTWKILTDETQQIIRTLRKSKYRQAKASRRKKHGWEAPRDYAHALQLDVQNGNNKLRDAIDLEIKQVE